MKHRSLPVSLTAAAASLAVVAAAAAPAAADPPPDPATPSACSRARPRADREGRAVAREGDRHGHRVRRARRAVGGRPHGAGREPRRGRGQRAGGRAARGRRRPQQATARSAGARNPQQVSVTSTLVAGVVVTGDAARVRDLARDASVRTVYRIIPKQPANKGTDVFTRALETWQSTGLTGEGVRIGIIDTGVDYTHKAFGGPGTQEAFDEGLRRPRHRPGPRGHVRRAEVPRRPRLRRVRLRRERHRPRHDARADARREPHRLARLGRLGPRLARGRHDGGVRRHRGRRDVRRRLLDAHGHLRLAGRPGLRARGGHLRAQGVRRPRRLDGRRRRRASVGGRPERRRRPLRPPRHRQPLPRLRRLARGRPGEPLHRPARAWARCPSSRRATRAT